MRTWLTVILALSLSGGHAKGQFFKAGDGREFLKMCGGSLGVRGQSDLGRQEIAACFGYLDGVAQGHLLTAARMGAKGAFYCMPRDATRMKQLRVVTKYLEEHPEKNSHYAAGIVIDAWKSAFPCAVP